MGPIYNCVHSVYKSNKGPCGMNDYSMSILYNVTVELGSSENGNVPAIHPRVIARSPAFSLPPINSLSIPLPLQQAPTVPPQFLFCFPCFSNPTDCTRHLRLHCPTQLMFPFNFKQTKPEFVSSARSSPKSPMRHASLPTLPLDSLPHVFVYHYRLVFPVCW